MGYDTFTIEEVIALRGKRQLRARGIHKSPQWWREFRAKVQAARYEYKGD